MKYPDGDLAVDLHPDGSAAFSNRAQALSRVYRPSACSTDSSPSKRPGTPRASACPSPGCWLSGWAAQSRRNMQTAGCASARPFCSELPNSYLLRGKALRNFRIDAYDGMIFFGGLVFFAPVALLVRPQAGVSEASAVASVCAALLMLCALLFRCKIKSRAPKAYILACDSLFRSFIEKRRIFLLAHRIFLQASARAGAAI